MNKKTVNQSRRNFIKTGVTGLAGAALIPGLAKKSVKTDTLSLQNKKKFIYRTLGRTGIKLPIVSIGAGHALSLIDAVFESGITHLDTSSGYENGNHEKMIGKVLKGRPRDSYVIATSFPMWMKYKDQTKVFTPEQMVKAIEGSLKRLELDYVDIYYLGGVSNGEVVLYKPFMKVMEKFKKEGKTKFIGVTAHMNEPEVLQACVDSKIYDVALIAQNIKKRNRDEITKAVAKAAKLLVPPVPPFPAMLGADPLQQPEPPPPPPITITV